MSGLEVNELQHGVDLVELGELLRWALHHVDQEAHDVDEFLRRTHDVLGPELVCWKDGSLQDQIEIEAALECQTMRELTALLHPWETGG